jgi:hypothetical protein
MTWNTKSIHSPFWKKKVCLNINNILFSYKKDIIYIQTMAATTFIAEISQSPTACIVCSYKISYT